MHLKIAVFFFYAEGWFMVIFNWLLNDIGNRKKIHMKLIRKINIPRIKKTAFFNAFLWDSLNEKTRFSLIKNCEKIAVFIAFCAYFRDFWKNEKISQVQKIFRILR